MRYMLVFMIFVGLGGCELAPDAQEPADERVTDAAVDAAPEQDDTEQPEPEEDALVVEEPAAEPSSGGTTVASLGDPLQSGLWMETPLVSQETQGRVRVVATGAEVSVTLRPIPGEASGSSRLSVEAMRALGVGLADLVEVDVIVSG